MLNFCYLFQGYKESLKKQSLGASINEVRIKFTLKPTKLENIALAKMLCLLIVTATSHCSSHCHYPCCVVSFFAKKMDNARHNRLWGIMFYLTIISWESFLALLFSMCALPCVITALELKILKQTWHQWWIIYAKKTCFKH